MKNKLKIIVMLVVLIALVLCGCLWFMKIKAVPEGVYTTATVKRGDLVATIGATGTIEPEEVVDVGAQVAGLINTFGTDRNGKMIDYGSEVEAGTVLAKIDDSMYAADARQSEAQVQQAKAQVAAAEANLLQLKARLDQAQRDWERARKIGSSDALAVSLYDGYKAAYDGAVANVTAGEAAILQARAAVAQAEAALSRTQLNLGYCVIKSPVKGVIIDRRVNIGQTVVASLNAPSLFLIAKDLKRMQVWVAVNEADIGNIKPGQPVTYTVDAFQGETFKGEVGQVRLNATMSQNVVTYTVEVNTDNSSGKLLPYLTANMQFQVDRRDNVMMVPNAALRWTPQPERIVPDARSVMGKSRHSAGAGMAGGYAQRNAVDAAGTMVPKSTVWVVDGKYVRPVRIRVGITDGTMTEVQGDRLSEGAEVILSEVSTAAGALQNGSNAASSTNSNPFVPQMPGRRR